jgi:thioredoxin-like negative regulator of GroEL
MTQTAEKTLEEIFQDSRVTSKKIFLVEVRADWSGSSHIIAPIIKKIENEFRHLIEVKRINLESNKKSLTEICSEFVPSVLFIRDGIVLKLLNGTFSKKSIEKILLDLLDGSDE